MALPTRQRAPRILPQRFIVTDSSGWLNVKLDGHGIVALPEYLKIQFSGRDNGRDYFTVLEGVYMGKKGSVSQRGVSTSWISTSPMAYFPAAKLTFLKSKEILKTPIGDIKAITHPTEEIPDGVHPIQIPSFPHGKGRGYLGRASKSLTWFYLGTGIAIPFQDDRYLHVGSYSAGCVTITEVGKWDSLYRLLIKSRLNGRHVGTIEVKD